MRSIDWSIVALLAGCATAPPMQQLSAASAAVGAAHEAGADSDAQAKAHLDQAQQEIAQARAAMDAGDNENANGLLIRAQADGQLAAAVAHETRFRLEADDVSRRAEALRRQNQL